MLGTRSPEDKGALKSYICLRPVRPWAVKGQMWDSLGSPSGEGGQRTPAVSRDVEPAPSRADSVGTDAYQALAVAAVKYFMWVTEVNVCHPMMYTLSPFLWEETKVQRSEIMNSNSVAGIRSWGYLTGKSALLTPLCPDRMISCSPDPAGDSSLNTPDARWHV